tara:strand:- start:301 stop:510 length:210 start_codon:yes stop_codon:yes gene_type:complete
LKNLLIIFATAIALSPAFYSPTLAPDTNHKQAFMNKFEQAFKLKQITPHKAKEQTFHKLFKKFENSSKK